MVLPLCVSSTITKKNNEDVKETYGFYKTPSEEDTIEEQIFADILSDLPYEHKK